MPESTDESLKELISELSLARGEVALGQVQEAWNRIRKARYECERIEEELHDFMFEENLKLRLPIQDAWREEE